MSAAACVLTSLIKPGDTILLPSDGYAPVRYYAERYLQRFGVLINTIATAEIDSYDFSGVNLALLETPSNPMLDTFDIALAAKKLHAQGGLLAVDNTTLTFLGQQALSLNADIVICADTKAVNGHSDVVFGHVATKQKDLFEQMQEWRKFSGNIAGPMETWLVHRSLSTLDMRLERMCNNAMQLAQLIAAHEQTLSIRYPGLSDDPSHATAKKQQLLFGFIISFELANKTAADAFLQHLQIASEATSFGGVHSSAERRARWGTDDIAEGLIRFSVGCEHIDDLARDVTQAQYSLLVNALKILAESIVQDLRNLTMLKSHWLCLQSVS